MSFCFIGDKEAAPRQMEPEKKKKKNRKTATHHTHIYGHAAQLKPVPRQGPYPLLFLTGIETRLCLSHTFRNTVVMLLTPHQPIPLCYQPALISWTLFPLNLAPQGVNWHL